MGVLALTSSRALKFICLVFMKYFPALDEKFEAWVQHTIVDNN